MKPLHLPPGAQITHTGDRYGVGAGQDFYAVWRLKDLHIVDRYPGTPEGWLQAWDRWQAIEEDYQAERVHRLNNPIWPFAHLVFGLFLIPFLEFLAIAAALALSGHDAGKIDGTLAGPAIFLTGLTGWFLFIYLWPRTIRWIGAGVIALGFIVGLMSAFANTFGAPLFP